MAAAAHAHPLADRIVEQLEASPTGCSAVAANQARRRLIEDDLSRFMQTVAVPPGVRFDVMDCSVDGFVYKGRSVVLSMRLARLSAPQRFFIIAHELGHIALAHHAAVSSFVARAVDTAADEAAARAAVNSGLTAISHRNEFEADAFAVRLMRENGLDPEEAARIFDSIGEGRDNVTHPSAGRRGRAIRALR